MKRFGTFSMLCFLFAACFLAQTVHAQYNVFTVKAKRVVVGSVAKGSGATPQKYYNPTGEYYISSGARVVAKGMRVYYQAVKVDTTSTQMSTYAWTLNSKPSASTATLNGAATQDMYFNPDVVGQYIIGLTVNGSATTADTIIVSTYIGNSATGFCGGNTFCHAGNQTEWAKTRHANIFKDGITGNLENDPLVQGGKGAYGMSCIKCHTTGWESKTDNGNFGYLANKSTFDSTWWKGLTKVGSDFFITKDDQTIWNSPTLTADMKNVSGIGCESCHGPANGHNGDKTKISKTLDAGTCNQCHNAVVPGTTAGKHNLGSYWLASGHANMEASTPPIGHATSSGCAKCHSGQGFVKSKLAPADAAKWPSDDYSNDANKITCPVCHDPHSDKNPNQLRTVSVDSLVNGFKPTTGGKGLLCMNCHQERKSVNAAVTTKAPYYGFGARFGAHHSPQADIYFAQNGYNYGQSLPTNTHGFGSVTDACVTCHMPMLSAPSSAHSNHAMTMDSAKVAGCTTCHSGVTKISDITMGVDYDGDGNKESFQDEVDGLMARIKAKLPLDSTGEPMTAMPTKADSARIANQPAFVKAIWNYVLVRNDGSRGVHNPKYVIALLKATLNDLTGTGVESTDRNVPKSFELSQNYPNPFNPTTDIRFSIPATSVVKLQVYNSIGQLVATLVNGTMEAGNYSAKLNGGNLASGIYLYRLEASSNGKSSFVTTKKMLLVK